MIYTGLLLVDTYHMNKFKAVGRYLLRLLGVFWILDGGFALITGGKSIYGGPETSTGSSLLNIFLGLLVWAWPIAAFAKTFIKAK